MQMTDRQCVCFDFFTLFLEKVQGTYTEEVAADIWAQYKALDGINRYNMQHILAFWKDDLLYSDYTPELIIKIILEDLGSLWAHPEFQKLFKKWLKLLNLQEDQFLIIRAKDFEDSQTICFEGTLKGDNIRILQYLPYFSERDVVLPEGSPILIIIPPGEVSVRK